MPKLNCISITLLTIFILLPAMEPREALAQQTSASWYDGAIQYSVITNCVSIIQGYPYSEYGVGTYVSYLANPNAYQPRPNLPYYIHVIVYGIGNPCSGTRVYIDIELPSNTVLAIDNIHPIYCFHDANSFSGSDCPQSLPASSLNNGAYAILSSDAANNYTWPVAQGHNFEFQIPVKSSTALTNSPFRANTWMIDGNSNSWLHPQQGLYVFQPVLISQTISFGQAPIISVGGTGTITATGGSSGNPILFTSETPSICSITGSTVRALVEGVCTIAANQAGDSNYNAAPQVTQSFGVTSGVECLLNWAENSYPHLYSPLGALSQFSSPYTYRFYHGTDTYVGVSHSDNHVYYLGPDRILLDVGELSMWLTTSGCQ